MFATPWKPPLRVALFGTSADPPHLGHQSILLWLAQEFDQVAVWAADNPYKEKQSPICDRAEMLRLLSETLPGEGTGPLGKVQINQSLSDRYSINSITRARKIWPKARFHFVVGADLIAQMPKWYQAKEIFSQVDILVFPRPGYPIEGPALSALRRLTTVNIAHPPAQHDVSSSRFRQTRCADDADIVNEDLPPTIRDYITEHNLYSCLQPTPKAKVRAHR
ncbi:MAG: nicotinate-nucleotide adenylyltransferase [Cyanobacteria bacterium J06629_19]